MIPIEDLIHLIDENCPDCLTTLEYDTATDQLYCPICGKWWNYGYIKDCKRAYKDDPQNYINHL